MAAIELTERQEVEGGGKQPEPGGEPGRMEEEVAPLRERGWRILAMSLKTSGSPKTT